MSVAAVISILGVVGIVTVGGISVHVDPYLRRASPSSGGSHGGSPPTREKSAFLQVQDDEAHQLEPSFFVPPFQPSVVVELDGEPTPVEGDGEQTGKLDGEQPSLRQLKKNAPEFDGTHSKQITLELDEQSTSTALELDTDAQAKKPPTYTGVASWRGTGVGERVLQVGGNVEQITLELGGENTSTALELDEHGATTSESLRQLNSRQTTLERAAVELSERLGGRTNGGHEQTTTALELFEQSTSTALELDEPPTYTKLSGNGCCKLAGMLSGKKVDVASCKRLCSKEKKCKYISTTPLPWWELAREQGVFSHVRPKRCQRVTHYYSDSTQSHRRCTRHGQ